MDQKLVSSFNFETKNISKVLSRGRFLKPQKIEDLD